jgi:hypothetical protein
MDLLLKKHGLRIFDVTRSPISGGSYVAYCDKFIRDRTNTYQTLKDQESKSAVYERSRWEQFGKDAESHKLALRELVFNNSDGRIAAYGASARSSTMMNYCNLNSDIIEFIIDKNTLKKGRWTPGTKIPIVGFEEGVQRLKGCANVFLGAWNFADEITKDLREASFEGRILCPLPRNPKII